jgi:DNA modification methylase
MRVYDNERNIRWADGESCPYGFEQTPEGFIRHTVELLLLLKPAVAAAGSVWWNITDVHNTRTPIRGKTLERLDAMGEASGTRKGWTEHSACRHSAGHRYLDDTELTSIPPRIAERASRIGYKFKSFITWRKHTAMPESAKNRVSRQAEYILHFSIGRTPFFDKKAWQAQEQKLGGPNMRYESAERITDVWSLPTSAGKNGPAEFPLALAGRCITLTSSKHDLVLDPFVGTGTTALAADELDRRCLGFDISEKYIQVAAHRLEAAGRERQEAAGRERQLPFDEYTDAESASSDTGQPQAATARLTSKTRPAGSDNSRAVVNTTPRSQSA